MVPDRHICISSFNPSKYPTSYHLFCSVGDQRGKGLGITLPSRFDLKLTGLFPLPLSKGLFFVSYQNLLWPLPIPERSWTFLFSQVSLTFIITSLFSHHSHLTNAKPHINRLHGVQHRSPDCWRMVRVSCWLSLPHPHCGSLIFLLISECSPTS